MLIKILPALLLFVCVPRPQDECVQKYIDICTRGTPDPGILDCPDPPEGCTPYINVDCYMQCLQTYRSTMQVVQQTLCEQYEDALVQRIHEQTRALEQYAKCVDDGGDRAQCLATYRAIYAQICRDFNHQIDSIDLAWNAALSSALQMFHACAQNCCEYDCDE